MLPQTYEVEIEQHRQIQGITAKKMVEFNPDSFWQFYSVSKLQYNLYCQPVTS